MELSKSREVDITYLELSSLKGVDNETLASFLENDGFVDEEDAYDVYRQLPKFRGMSKKRLREFIKNQVLVEPR